MVWSGMRCCCLIPVDLGNGETLYLTELVSEARNDTKGSRITTEQLERRTDYTVPETVTDQKDLLVAYSPMNSGANASAITKTPAGKELVISFPIYPSADNL